MGKYTGLAASLLRAPDLLIRACALARYVQAQDLGRAPLSPKALRWDESGTSEHTARWETIDGVRTPVMVCPKRKTFELAIPSEAWCDKATGILFWHRSVLACDDYTALNFGGELPRVALVSPFLFQTP